MKKLRKIVITSATAFIIAIMAIFVSACNDKEATISFETNGGTPIPAITAKVGEHIVPPTAPTKENYIFMGWYLTPDFSGESVYVADVMPEKSVTYYAKFEPDPALVRGIIYEYNNTATKTGDVEPSKALPGETVTVKDGADYNASGYLFMGWSTASDGKIQFTDGKAEGQYNAGESYTVTDDNITLYAQWAKSYKQKNGNDTVYFYDGLFGLGIGGAITIKNGERKLGFASENIETGYLEFEFIYEDGSVYGRIDLENETEFTYADATKGSFLGVDYVTDDLTGDILTSDGYGAAVVTGVVGSLIKNKAFGYYTYDASHNDYTFWYIDPITGAPIMDGDEIRRFYFATMDVADYGDYRGAFYVQGYESGSFMLYDNGELYNTRLDLNGYGYAKLYDYNPIDQTTELIAEGAYKGTDNYEDFMGEWEFYSNNPEIGDFKFILNAIASSSDYINVYIEYNARYDKEFTAVSGNGDTLYLDGYGSAMYTSGSENYIGYCTVNSSETLVTFVPYISDGNGNMTVGGTMFFDINYAAGTFKVNTTGYIIDGTTLTGYVGSSKIIVIPDEVTAIADNVFNYAHSDTGLSIVSVVIPASVQSIGILAFENEHTLSRATFLAEEPIDIDWASDKNPFRWPAGNFIIVVPENSVAAYKAAWSDCPYTILGSIEVTILPEFEIENGVLVRYNKPEDSADELNIVIPDDVTEIAANVFRGLSYIKSVDFNNVTKIGDGAFEYCTSLTSATFTNVRTIGEGAFADSGLTGTIELLSIVEVGDSAFAGCTGLRRVRLGSGLVEIGSYAFMECQIDESEDALYVELLGDSAPFMGGSIAAGNIAFRIVVKNIIVVMQCYEAGSWSPYIRHLYIESGEEAGTYMSGANTLVLDGRAVLDGFRTFIYSIVDESITLYEYDAKTNKYGKYLGIISNGAITIELDGITYKFEKVGSSKTYTSEDGLYTLTCDPRALDPEYYENNKGYTDITFNGKPAQLYISGYNTKQVNAFRDEDGKLYDFAITFNGDTFTYTKKAANFYVRDIQSDDGSVISLHFSGGAVYIFGTINIEVNGSYMTSMSDYSFSATQVSDNVYTFKRNYGGSVYNITVTVSSDNTTFTYTYTVE